MEDSQIIQLYFERSEDAISQTAVKYGKYLHTIANNILCSFEDSEECVSDTYWKAWSVIPPRRPRRFSAFLGKITRNLSLDRYRQRTAEKRGSGEFAVALEELGDCVSQSGSMDNHADDMVLTELLNRFLTGLPAEQRKIFIKRYWYVCSVKEIADDLGISESKVKMSLLRSRNQLKALLEKEGIAL